MDLQPRRSSRANKGQHTSRDISDVYYQAELEPEPKKRKVEDDDEFEKDEESEEDVVSGDDDVNDEEDSSLGVHKGSSARNGSSSTTSTSTTSRSSASSADTEVSGNEGEVRCDPCGTTQANYNEDTDEGGTMIECDNCNTWQHARCMGYRTQRAIPSVYNCNRCRKPVKVEKPPKIANKTRTSVVTALAAVLAKASAEVALAESIEEAIFTWAGGNTDKKYTDKSRSIMALVKRLAVLLRLQDGLLSCTDVVVMPPEEIDRDLKEYAEKVRQELIRRTVLTVDDELLQRIRRTHKGEEIVETNSGSQDDDVSIVGRNIDHRKFRESTPPRDIIAVQGRNLYQYDDEEEEDDEKKEKEDVNHDSDDELDFILKEPSPEPVQTSQSTPEISSRASSAGPVGKPAPTVPTMPLGFWSGEITFPDFASFPANAEFTSCSGYVAPRDNITAAFHNRALRVCKELLEKHRYLIEGRLDRARADPYLDKITSSRDLYVVEVKPQGPNSGYEKLFEYLFSRQKVGVLSDKASCVKDAYLFALDNDAPRYLSFAPATRGLFAVFVVKKDYVPVGKSILKKATTPTPAPAPVDSLDAILSKLGQPAQPQPQELSSEQLRYLSELVSQNPHVQQNPQALLSLLQQDGMP